MNDRQTIVLTAGREIRERVRSRAYRASTGIQLLIVLLIVGISAVTGGDDSTSYDIGASGTEAVALVDGLQSQTLRDVTVATKEVEDEGVARAQVADGELDAAVVDGELIIGPDTDDELIGLLQGSAQRDRAERTLEDAGLEEEQIRHALDPAGLPIVEVGEDRESGDGIAFIGSLLLYLGILGSAFLVTSGVVEEKGSRVVELLLATIRPVHLLAGKVIGIGLVGILQLALTVIVGVAAALLSGQIDLPSSTVATVALSLVYFVLGYALYACAFAAAGSIVSRQEDVGSVTTPLTLLLVAGYLASFSIADDPTGTLATVCTFLPPVAPLIVPARAAVDGLPVWELAVSLGLMLVAIAGLMVLAGRIYERAILRVGAPMKLLEGLRLARSSGRS